MWLKFAKYLETLSERIRGKVYWKQTYKFFSKYNLVDGDTTFYDDSRYNPYDMTFVSMIDKLIESGEILKDDRIMDIGCGAGIFLIYLASKGFENLYGVELDKSLVELANSNILNYHSRQGLGNVEISCNNALEWEVNDDINIFYLANPFRDKEVYTEWLDKVYKSLLRRKRDIKIILYFPTVASKAALQECEWLAKKCEITDKNQVCWRCVKFSVYENK